MDAARRLEIMSDFYGERMTQAELLTLIALGDGRTDSGMGVVPNPARRRLTGGAGDGGKDRAFRESPLYDELPELPIPDLPPSVLRAMQVER